LEGAANSIEHPLHALSVPEDVRLNCRSHDVEDVQM